MPYVGLLPECGLYALMWAFCLDVGFVPLCGLFASMWAFCLGMQFYPVGSLPFHVIIWVIYMITYCLLFGTFMWALCSRFTCFDLSIGLFALYFYINFVH